MTDAEISKLAAALEKRLDPRFAGIEKRLVRLSDRIDSFENRVTAAMLAIADALPGSVPGVKSYARKQVERALEASE